MCEGYAIDRRVWKPNIEDVVHHESGLHGVAFASQVNLSTYVFGIPSTLGSTLAKPV